MTADRSFEALTVHRRGTVRAAFVGVVAGAERLSPDVAFEVLGRAIGVAPAVRPAWLCQEHGTLAVRAEEPGAGGRGDILIVQGVGIAATVFVADCVPVLIAAGDAVAAVHAGWRGIQGGVLPASKRALGQLVDLEREPVEAWVGPAIGPCCYEVGDDVAKSIEAMSHVEVTIRHPGRKPRVDLRLAVISQLRQLDIAAAWTSPCCVRCDSRWHSFRRDGPRSGRNFGFIWRAGSPG